MVQRGSLANQNRKDFVPAKPQQFGCRCSSLSLSLSLALTSPAKSQASPGPRRPQKHQGKENIGKKTMCLTDLGRPIPRSVGNTRFATVHSNECSPVGDHIQGHHPLDTTCMWNNYLLLGPNGAKILSGPPEVSPGNWYRANVTSGRRSVPNTTLEDSSKLTPSPNPHKTHRLFSGGSPSPTQRNGQRKWALPCSSNSNSHSSPEAWNLSGLLSTP